jgi:hypothetical protein
MGKRKAKVLEQAFSMATFQIIGVYKITPTVESIIQAVKFHKYEWLLDENDKFADTLDWEKFENLSLIEMQVSGDFSPRLLQAISQRHAGDFDGSEQVPYLEYYLDESGKNLLSEQEAVSTDHRRVCFFLHFTDTSLPLKVGETLIELPSMAELSERLIEFTHYVPPD